MSSSAAVRLYLVPHPVIFWAANQAGDATLVTRFRTFDPSDELHPYKWLDNARVALVRNGETTPLLVGVTNSGGYLRTGINSTLPLVVEDVQDLPAEAEYHFEVLGPADDETLDLRSMTYPDGTTPPQYFPVAKWSTEGWKEAGPQGIPGSFRLTKGVHSRIFTVGCRIDVPLTFKRGSGEPGPFPENIRLGLVIPAADPVVVNTVTELHVKPGGRLSAVVFAISPGDTVAIVGFFKAREITPEAITEVTATIKVDGVDCSWVEGEHFGLGKIPNVSSIDLFRNQAAPAYPSTVVKPTEPRLNYSSYGVNMAGVYRTTLTPEQKRCVCFNWFLEFVAYRNLFVRALRQLLSESQNSQWTDPNCPFLQSLTLSLDENEGGASTSAPNSILAHLEFILKPTDDVCVHEMSHAFAMDNWSPTSSQIHFPSVTNDHQINSYSNEFFAFQEGFAQFMAALFMDPVDAYDLRPPPAQPPAVDWRKMYYYQAPPGPHQVDHGYIDGCSEATVTSLEAGVGLVLEGAFAGALSNLWTHGFWETWTNSTNLSAGTKSWVLDPKHDGTLNVILSPIPNRWLIDPDVQKKFSYFIFGAIADAAQVDTTGMTGGKVAGRISTRRVVDRIEKRTASSSNPWPSITWAAIKPFFDRFWVVNEFYVSSLQGSISPEYIIVRSSVNARRYASVNSATQQPAPVRIRSTGESFTLRGIRFPVTFSCRLVAGSNPNSGLPLVSIATATSEYTATVQFTAGQLAPAQLLPCHLLIETAPGLPANKDILLTSVEIVAP